MGDGSWEAPFAWVFEIYTDVTAFHVQIEVTGRTHALVVAAVFATIFLLLLAAVWYGDRLVLRNHQITLRMTDSAARSEAAIRAKTEFLANMSHELRTPLNAIIGFAEIMKGEKLGPLGVPSYHEYVLDIEDSGRHLLSIINDVLELSRIEAGRLEISDQLTRISRLVAATVKLAKIEAQEKNI